jgi:3-phosphoshikimate 1-carboxyvinyltransferase
VSTDRHDLIVLPCVTPLRGSVPAPPDDDLGNLALLIAALSEGMSEIRHLGRGNDVTSMSSALRQLGVKIDEGANGAALVHGVSLRGLVDPGAAVSVGTSERTLVRLASVLAGHPFRTVLTQERRAEGGFEASRTMTLVAAALRRRAAQVEGTFSTRRAGELESPFTVGPLPVGHALSGIEIDLESPGPDVKEALLLSGLYADEATYVREAVVSRDHVERMLQALGVPMQAAGPIAMLEASNFDGKIAPFTFDVPGDVGAAIFFLTMSALVPESRVCVRRTGLNPTRTGTLDLMRQMGASIEIAVAATPLGEIEGTVCASPAPLRALPIGGEGWLRAANDLPALAALAARASGTTEIATESAKGYEGVVNRVANVLRAFGVAVEIDAERLFIAGQSDGPLRAARVDAGGDVASAEIAVLLALIADGPTTIGGVDGLADRFPRFVGTMRALGADVRVEKAS